MAEPYRKNALLNALGVEDEDPQQSDPMPSPAELPPAMGAAPGIAPGEMTPNQGPPPIIDQVASAPIARKNTRLMEGDEGKLADIGHAAKSPKYDFLQLANQGKYGYDQLGDMLGELQKGPNAQHWQGWTADKDKLRFTGDPSQLGSAWNGVTEVDAIGGFNSGNPQGFRWGANDPGGGGEPAPSAGGSRGVRAPSNLNPMLQGNPMASIQDAIAQLMQGGNAPNLQALLAQLGGGQ